jgi:hypothetical protein
MIKVRDILITLTPSLNCLCTAFKPNFGAAEHGSQNKTMFQNLRSPT